jgi:hypothetical protein
VLPYPLLLLLYLLVNAGDGQNITPVTYMFGALGIATAGAGALRRFAFIPTTTGIGTAPFFSTPL